MIVGKLVDMDNFYHFRSFNCIYLKGNLQGYDWTDVPSDVLPYSELIYDIKKNLWIKVKIISTFYLDYNRDIVIKPEILCCIDRNV